MYLLRFLLRNDAKSTQTDCSGNMSALVTIFYIINILVAGLTFCCEAREFQCKPRPGCHMARCDPSQHGLVGLLQSNEYPITCQRINSEDKEDFVTRQDYKKLRKEMAKFRKGEEIIKH